MRKRIKFSLKLKIIVSFFFLSALISIFIAISLNKVLEDSLFRELQARLKNIAYLSTQSIDIEIYKKLLDKLKPDLSFKEKVDVCLTEEYTKISNQFNSIINAEKDLLLYVYSLYPTEKEHISKIIVENATQENILWLKEQIEKAIRKEENELKYEIKIENKDFSDESITNLLESIVKKENVFLFGEDYDMSEFPVMIEALKTKTNLVENELFFDFGGGEVGSEEVSIWSISGYAPIFDDDGTYLGLIGVDISAKDIQKATKSARETSLIIGIISVIVSLGVSILIGSVFTKNITKLNGIVKRFANKDLKIRANVKSKDEVKDLADSFNNMAETIQNYNEHLEDLVNKRTEELNKVNKELLMKNQMMLREFKMAEIVQKSMIPTEKDFPKRVELGFGSSYSAMEKIGGDLYDVIKIDNNRYALLIADVSGHGVPAALIMSMVKVSFNANSVLGLPADKVCERVNQELFKLIGDLEYYLTAYYGIINIETGIFEYVNAGHHPSLLISKKGTITTLDTKEGFLIGALEDPKFEIGKIELKEGDRVLLFTDGIIEARNREGDFYEYYRFIKFIEKNYHLATEEFVDNLIKDVETFCEKRPPTDDKAILLMEFISKIKPNEPLEKSLHIEIGDFEKNQLINIKTGYKQAINLINEKKYEDALKLLVYLNKKYPTNEKILNSLGIVYYKLNRLQEAYDNFQNAVMIDKTNKVYKKNLLKVINKMK